MGYFHPLAGEDSLKRQVVDGTKGRSLSVAGNEGVAFGRNNEGSERVYATLAITVLMISVQVNKYLLL